MRVWNAVYIKKMFKVIDIEAASNPPFVRVLKIDKGKIKWWWEHKPNTLKMTMAFITQSKQKPLPTTEANIEEERHI